ncbi:triacylglycerol lipase [Maricurvus nonylphenolicus]|uniref:esterase/lipase family protein n=1 Tax=Maricurvus nonylphenolicus TaxID=1008307 RepID=UPI0036F32A2C
MFTRNTLILLSSLLITISAHASTYTQTKYPIVLLSGVMGSPNAFGPIPTEYFYGIEQALESSGARVYVAPLSPLHEDYTRGEQARRFIEEIVIPYEHSRGYHWVDKVNILGHSQGGITARYVAGVHPHLVATISTIGTPHNAPTKGMSLTDFFILATQDDNVLGQLGRIINGLFGDISSWLSGTHLSNDLDAALEHIENNFAAFNQDFPQALPTGSPCGEGQYVVNGIPYFSMGGTSPLTNFFDPSDAALGTLSLILQVDDKNDGAIGRCQTHIGKVIRDNYVMNHGDEINALYGIVSPFATNPRTVYRKHANYLKNMGL